MAGWWREGKKSGVVVRGGSQVFGRRLARPGSLASRDGPAGFHVDRGWARRRGRRMRADLRGLGAPDHPERGVAPDSGRVGRWRGALRVRCVTRSLSRRRQACLPQVRFHLLLTMMLHATWLTEPDVRISRTRLPSGIMRLAHGAPVRGRFGRGTESFAWPQLPEAVRRHPRCPSPTRRQACSRPDGIETPCPPGWAVDQGAGEVPWRVVHAGVSMQHRRRDDRAREAGACATRSRAEHAEGADRSASGGMARALDVPPGAAGASGEAAHCTR